MVPILVQQNNFREEGNGVVYYVQGEHQSYLLHYYQNTSIQDKQIQCSKDQIQVSHVDKDMMEQSNTQGYPIPLLSQSIRST